jgi:hypothetical protein
MPPGVGYNGIDPIIPGGLNPTGSLITPGTDWTISPEQQNVFDLYQGRYGGLVSDYPALNLYTDDDSPNIDFMDMLGLIDRFKSGEITGPGYFGTGAFDPVSGDDLSGPDRPEFDVDALVTQMIDRLMGDTRFTGMFPVDDPAPEGFTIQDLLQHPGFTSLFDDDPGHEGFTIDELLADPGFTSMLDRGDQISVDDFLGDPRFTSLFEDRGQQWSIDDLLGRMESSGIFNTQYQGPQNFTPDDIVTALIESPRFNELFGGNFTGPQAEEGWGELVDELIKKFGGTDTTGGEEPNLSGTVDGDDDAEVTNFDFSEFPGLDFEDIPDYTPDLLGPLLNLVLGKTGAIDFLGQEYQDAINLPSPYAAQYEVDEEGNRVAKEGSVLGELEGMLTRDTEKQLENLLNQYSVVNKLGTGSFRDALGGTMQEGLLDPLARARIQFGMEEASQAEPTRRNRLKDVMDWQEWVTGNIGKTLGQATDIRKGEVGMQSDILSTNMENFYNLLGKTQQSAAFDQWMADEGLNMFIQASGDGSATPGTLMSGATTGLGNLLSGGGEDPWLAIARLLGEL